VASLAAAALGGCAARPPTGAPPTSTDSSTVSTGTPESPATAVTTATPTARPDPPSSVDADWPMPAADPGRSSAVLDAAGPTDRPAALWETEADATLTQPVLAGGALYVGASDGRLLAFDARTGDRRWERPVGAPAARPWVLDGSVYAPTADGVVAFDAGGTERWRVPTPNRAGLAVASHGLYWLADGDAATVVALARSDGSERWRTTLDGPWKPPVFASEDRVFVSSGTHDYRFWQLGPETGDRLGEGPRDGNDFPAEHCYRDGAVFAADAFFGNVYATPVAEGRSGWSQGVDGLGRAAMSADGERAYYLATHGDAPGLYALSAADGSVEWTAEFTTEQVHPPVVADETILVRSADALRCFDPADGAERWTRPVDDVGPGVVVADDLVFTADGAALRAFRPP